MFESLTEVKKYEDDDRNSSNMCCQIECFTMGGNEVSISRVEHRQEWHFLRLLKVFFFLNRYHYVEMQQVYTYSTPAFFLNLFNIFCVVQYEYYLSYLL